MADVVCWQFILANALPVPLVFHSSRLSSLPSFPFFLVFSLLSFLVWTSCDPGISSHLLGLVVDQVDVSPIPPWGQGRDVGIENI